MRVIIFTCERDKGKAALATRTVPHDWPVAWVVDSKDEWISAPANVDVLVRDFPRGRNLYGPEAVIGIIEVLNEQTEEHGRVAKIDSDCLLIDPSFLERGDIAGMAHQGVVGGAYGLAYALSLKASQKAWQTLLRAISLGTKPMAEDVCITSAAQSSEMEDGRLPIGAFWESHHDGSLPVLGRNKAVHCGCTVYSKREGPQVEQEMQRIGDALSLWRR